MPPSHPWSTPEGPLRATKATAGTPSERIRSREGCSPGVAGSRSGTAHPRGTGSAPQGGFPPTPPSSRQRCNEGGLQGGVSLKHGALGLRATQKTESPRRGPGEGRGGGLGGPSGEGGTGWDRVHDDHPRGRGKEPSRRRGLPGTGHPAAGELGEDCHPRVGVAPWTLSACRGQGGRGTQRGTTGVVTESVTGAWSPRPARPGAGKAGVALPDERDRGKPPR